MPAAVRVTAVAPLTIADRIAVVVVWFAPLAVRLIAHALA